MGIYKCPKCGNEKEMSAEFSLRMRMDCEGVPEPEDFDITALDIVPSGEVHCLYSGCRHCGPEKDFVN